MDYQNHIRRVITEGQNNSSYWCNSKTDYQHRGRKWRWSFCVLARVRLPFGQILFQREYVHYIPLLIFHDCLTSSAK